MKSTQLIRIQLAVLGIFIFVVFGGYWSITGMFVLLICALIKGDDEK